MPSSIPHGRYFVSECLACKLMGPFPVANICPACYAAIPRMGNACLTCGTPCPTEVAACGSCLASPPAQQQSFIACPYVSPVDRWLRNLKDNHDLTCLPVLRQLLIDRLRECSNLKPDMLLPMPVHWSRRCRRGFNQSELLARELAKTMSLDIHYKILCRSRAVKSQRGLSRKERQKNQQNSFLINTNFGEQIEGKSILLVDDILTTGATLNEAAKTLKKGGAERVFVAAVARTPSADF